MINIEKLKDKDFRNQLRENPKACTIALGLNLENDTEIKLGTCSIV